ncbi:MAG: hypothetical protein AAF787_20045 [Chloroflexota bacterium]
MTDLDRDPMVARQHALKAQQQFQQLFPKQPLSPQITDRLWLADWLCLIRDNWQMTLAILAGLTTMILIVLLLLTQGA